MQQKYDILLKNAKLADHPELVDLTILAQTILEIGPNKEDARQVIDIGGRLLVPGFIDVHVQGAGGADVLDGTIESLQTLSRTLAQFGTTGFLATSLVHADSENRHLQQAAAAIGQDLGGARILGIHLEGPFINPKRRGGLAPDSIYPSSAGALKQVLSFTGAGLKMMTIAPELNGNLDIIRALCERDIVASFGHSDATYDQTRAGFAAGIRHVTHLFNAMPGLNHREPGPLPAIFEHKKVSAQIISDGAHLHPAVVRLAYHMLGPSRCVCITDGIQAMGLPPGRYLYNGREYESDDGTARYLDGTLIGSALPLAQMALRFHRFTGCTLAEAVNAGSLNPARLLGIDDRKGSISPGKDADLVALDEDFTAWLSVVNGKVVWRKE